MPRFPVEAARLIAQHDIVQVHTPMLETVLVTALARLQGKPSIIIAHTIKGKGVSFMENNPKFHGMAPTREEAARAFLELA